MFAFLVCFYLCVCIVYAHQVIRDFFFKKGDFSGDIHFLTFLSQIFLIHYFFFTSIFLIFNKTT